jgi:hypothetical protein
MVEGEIQAPQEEKTDNKVQRWGYETRFKSYLYRISVLGERGVAPIDDFPTRIELNDKWHETLDRIKTESQDGKERWVPVGMKEDRKMDFIPQSFVRGYSTHAVVLNPAEIKEKYGIVHKGGEIHSHPSDWFNSLGIRLITAARLVKDYEGFSDADLYNMVNGSGMPMSAVVERSHNYFVFRTAQTKDLPAESPLRPKMAFNRHWNRKFRGYFLGKSYQTFWPSPQFSIRNLNRAIAEHYNLALYRGEPGKDLVRQYPLVTG